MRNSLIALSILLLHGPVLAEPASREALPALPLELDLATAIQLADQYNPQILQARERINELHSAKKVTDSNRLPDLDAFGIYQIEQQDRVASFGGESEPDDTIWQAGVELRQPLYAGGRLSASSKARELEIDASEFDAAAARARVFADIYRKFYDARLARETVAVQEESLALITEQLQLASNRFAAGSGAKFDVLQAEVRVANARPPLIRAVSDLTTAIDDLRNSIGLPYPTGAGPTNITLTGEWDNLLPSDDLEQSIAIALQDRPELLALRKTRDAGRAYVKRYQRNRMPEIDFYAGYGIQNDRYSPDDITLEGWQVGVRADLSIWGGGETSGEIARYRSRLAQLESQVAAAELDIELEVRNAWNAALEAESILEATELVIAQAEEALRLAQNRYRAGALTQLDVLSSELEFTRARLEKITAVRNFNLAVIELNRAVGRTPGLENVEETP